MHKISIVPKTYAPWGVADSVALHVDFYLGMETFTIGAQLYGGEDPVGSEIPLAVSLATLQEWTQEAAQHPEKATFLNFQIVQEWCLCRLELQTAEEV